MWEDEITIRVLNNDVYLDEHCWRCENNTDKKEDCPECKGIGFSLTENGRAIFDLIKRHTKKD